VLTPDDWVQIDFYGPDKQQCIETQVYQQAFLVTLRIPEGAAFVRVSPHE